MPSWKMSDDGSGSAVRHMIQTNSAPVICIARARVRIAIVSALHTAPALSRTDFPSPASPIYTTVNFTDEFGNVSLALL